MSLITGIAETIIVGGKVMSILSTVGTNLIITTVTKSTSTIVGSIANITSYDQPGAQEVVAKLQTIDLEFMVKVIGELVKEQKHNDKESKWDSKDSVKTALLGVLEMLEKIERELNIIEEAVKEHDQKYFNGWRSFDCSCNIKTIEAHTNILQKRYEKLRDLLMIYP